MARSTNHSPNASAFYWIGVLFVCCAVILRPAHSSGVAGVLLGIDGGSGSDGVFSGAVDPSSGTLSLPLTLAQIPGMASAKVAIQYSNLIQEEVRTRNQESQTGYVGLGWQMDHPVILRDNAGTGTYKDDTFYYNGLELRLVSKTVAGDHGHNHAFEYSLPNAPYVSVFHYWNDESDIQISSDYWEVVGEGNSVQRFGGTDASRVVGVKWGNFIGARPSFEEETGEHYVSEWHLDFERSAHQVMGGEGTIEDVNWIEYDYGSTTEKIISYDEHLDLSTDGYISFTREIWLKSIRNNLGYEITLLYEDKPSAEVVDPHQEQPEPDAYQERYITKRLAEVRVAGYDGKILNTLLLDYSLESARCYGTDTDNTGTVIAKSFLKELIPFNNGREDKPLKLDYRLDTLPDEDEFYGMLESVTQPSGLRTQYEYQMIETGVSRSLEISPPDYSGHSDYTGSGEMPEAWATPSHIVVTWEMPATTGKRLVCQVYEWIGGWRKTFEDDLGPATTEIWTHNHQNLDDELHYYPGVHVQSWENTIAIVPNKYDTSPTTDMILLKKDFSSTTWNRSNFAIRIHPNESDWIQCDNDRAAVQTVEIAMGKNFIVALGTISGFETRIVYNEVSHCWDFDGVQGGDTAYPEPITPSYLGYIAPSEYTIATYGHINMPLDPVVVHLTDDCPLSVELAGFKSYGEFTKNNNNYHDYDFTTDIYEDMRFRRTLDYRAPRFKISAYKNYYFIENTSCIPLQPTPFFEQAISAHVESVHGAAFEQDFSVVLLKPQSRLCYYEGNAWRDGDDGERDDWVVLGNPLESSEYYSDFLVGQDERKFIRNGVLQPVTISLDALPGAVVVQGENHLPNNWVSRPKVLYLNEDYTVGEVIEVSNTTFEGESMFFHSSTRAVSYAGAIAISSYPAGHNEDRVEFTFMNLNGGMVYLPYPSREKNMMMKWFTDSYEEYPTNVQNSYKFDHIPVELSSSHNVFGYAETGNVSLPGALGHIFVFNPSIASYDVQDGWTHIDLSQGGVDPSGFLFDSYRGLSFSGEMLRTRDRAYSRNLQGDFQCIGSNFISSGELEEWETSTWDDNIEIIEYHERPHFNISKVVQGSRFFAVSGGSVTNSEMLQEDLNHVYIIRNGRVINQGELSITGHSWISTTTPSNVSIESEDERGTESPADGQFPDEYFHRAGGSQAAGENLVIYFGSEDPSAEVARNPRLYTSGVSIYRINGGVTEELGSRDYSYHNPGIPQYQNRRIQGPYDVCVVSRVVIDSESANTPTIARSYEWSTTTTFGSQFYCDGAGGLPVPYVSQHGLSAKFPQVDVHTEDASGASNGFIRSTFHLPAGPELSAVSPGGVTVLDRAALYDRLSSEVYAADGRLISSSANTFSSYSADEAKNERLFRDRKPVAVEEYANGQFGFLQSHYSQVGETFELKEYRVVEALRESISDYGYQVDANATSTSYISEEVDGMVPSTNGVLYSDIAEQINRQTEIISMDVYRERHEASGIPEYFTFSELDLPQTPGYIEIDLQSTDRVIELSLSMAESIGDGVVFELYRSFEHQHGSEKSLVKLFNLTREMLFLNGASLEYKTTFCTSANGGLIAFFPQQSTFTLYVESYELDLSDEPAHGDILLSSKRTQWIDSAEHLHPDNPDQPIAFSTWERIGFDDQSSQATFKWNWSEDTQNSQWRITSHGVRYGSNLTVTASKQFDQSLIRNAVVEPLEGTRYEGQYARIRSGAQYQKGEIPVATFQNADHGISEWSYLNESSSSWVSHESSFINFEHTASDQLPDISNPSAVLPTFDFASLSENTSICSEAYSGQFGLRLDSNGQLRKNFALDCSDLKRSFVFSCWVKTMENYSLVQNPDGTIQRGAYLAIRPIEDASRTTRQDPQFPALGGTPHSWPDVVVPIPEGHDQEWQYVEATIDLTQIPQSAVSQLIADFGEVVFWLRPFIANANDPFSESIIVDDVLFYPSNSAVEANVYDYRKHAYVATHRNDGHVTRTTFAETGVEVAKTTNLAPPTLLTALGLFAHSYNHPDGNIGVNRGYTFKSTHSYNEHVQYRNAGFTDWSLGHIPDKKDGWYSDQAQAAWDVLPVLGDGYSPRKVSEAAIPLEHFDLSDVPKAFYLKVNTEQVDWLDSTTGEIRTLEFTFDDDDATTADPRVVYQPYESSYLAYILEGGIEVHHPEGPPSFSLFLGSSSTPKASFELGIHDIEDLVVYASEGHLSFFVGNAEVFNWRYQEMSEDGMMHSGQLKLYAPEGFFLEEYIYLRDVLRSCVFTDALGNVLQTQRETTFAGFATPIEISQTLYDTFNRPYVTTIPVVMNASWWREHVNGGLYEGDEDCGDDPDCRRTLHVRLGQYQPEFVESYDSTADQITSGLILEYYDGSGFVSPLPAINNDAEIGSTHDLNYTGLAFGNRPHTRTLYDDSPSSRKLTVIDPGEGRDISSSSSWLEETNQSWWMGYAPGQIHIRTDFDVRGDYVQSYTNSMGQVLCVKSSTTESFLQVPQDPLIRFSVKKYDNYGNLVAESDPKYATAFDPSYQDGGVFYNVTHEYSEDRTHLIASHRIDDESEYFVYDALGILRLTWAGHAISEKGTYNYYKYDRFGRVLEEGYISLPPMTDRNVLEDLVNDADWPRKTEGAILRNRYEYANDNGPYNRNVLTLIESSTNSDWEPEFREELVYGPHGVLLRQFETLQDHDWGVDSRTTQFEYDHRGRVARLIYPDLAATELEYTYDDANSGRLTDIHQVLPSGSKRHWAQYIYNLRGQLEQETLGKGMAGSQEKEIVYDNLGRKRQVRNQSSKDGNSGGYLFQQQFYYENDFSNHQFGQVSELFSLSGPTVGGTLIEADVFTTANAYTYSGTGQLQSARHYREDGTVSYSMTDIEHDLNGNIFSCRENGALMQYTYNTINGQESNQVHTVVGADLDRLYMYDGLGRVSNSYNDGSAAKTIEYDPFNQRTSLMQLPDNDNRVRYDYDSAQRRVYKQHYRYITDPYKKLKAYWEQDESLYLFGTNDAVLCESHRMVNKDFELSYIYGLGGGAIAVLRTTETTESHQLLVRDFQGSTRQVFNDLGDLVAQYNYEPFGSILQSEATEEVRYLFTGQEYDSESGLHNFKARLYDSDTGVFFATDPAEEFASPYLYTNGNPIAFTDPSGEEIITTIGTILKVLGYIKMMITTAEIINEGGNLHDVLGYLLPSLALSEIGSELGAGIGSELAGEGLGAAMVQFVVQSSVSSVITSQGNSISIGPLSMTRGEGVHSSWFQSGDPLDVMMDALIVLQSAVSAVDNLNTIKVAKQAKYRSNSEDDLRHRKAESDREIESASVRMTDEDTNSANTEESRTGTESEEVKPKINTQLKEDGEGHYSYSSSRSRQYGTEETMRSLDNLVAAWEAKYPDGPRIGIGDISNEGGGKMKPHKTHQKGTNVDMRPLRTDGLERPVVISDKRYSRVYTSELVKLLLADPNVRSVLFNDTAIPGVIWWEHHDNHLHINFHN